MQSNPALYNHQDFSQQLERRARSVENALSDLLPKPHGRQSIIFESMRYAALGGGKRLRPFLMLETAALFDVTSDFVMRAACALECVHVYSLVHDDLPAMDDDDLRRGKPTVHKAFNEAIAVLAGDALLTYAFTLLSDPISDADPALQMRLIADLSHAAGVRGMIGGQVIDISLSETDRDEALITELQALKTGALIEYAVIAGAKIAGATPVQLTALSGYARDMGLAFQIKDDILDVEGDAAVIGKAVGKDANLGKATFVSILGLDGAKEKAAYLGKRAKGHLEPFGKKANILCEAVDFVLERNR